MKIYISGKITGLPENEVSEKFKKAADAIRAKGHEPVSPPEFVTHYEGKKWEDYMLNECLPELLKCDAILSLDDTNESNGAICEYWFARGCGIEWFGDINEMPAV